MDLIYLGSRKRQVLLSILGACRPWERVEGDGEEGRGSEKNVFNKIINKKEIPGFPKMGNHGLTDFVSSWH